jgi:hypothetical protein
MYDHIIYSHLLTCNDEAEVAFGDIEARRRG